MRKRDIIKKISQIAVRDFEFILDNADIIWYNDNTPIYVIEGGDWLYDTFDKLIGPRDPNYDEFWKFCDLSIDEIDEIWVEAIKRRKIKFYTEKNGKYFILAKGTRLSRDRFIKFIDSLK